MNKKTMNAFNELFEDKNQVVQVIATKGNCKRIYQNIKTWDTVQKIIDTKTSEGWEIKVIG